MRFFLSLLCYFCLAAKVFASEASFEGEPRQKIYVESSQIIFTDNQISVEFNGELMHVSQIGCDELGVYFWAPGQDDATLDIKKCFNGHKAWCTSCDGCSVRYCKGRCKCAAWE